MNVEQLISHLEECWINSKNDITREHYAQRIADAIAKQNGLPVWVPAAA